LFAISFIESCLLEWARDEPLGRKYDELAEYLPTTRQQRRQGIITKRWEIVTTRLHQDGHIPARPKYSGAAWDDFVRLVQFRNGLVHGRTGRPQTTDTLTDARPSPTVDDLTKMAPGWPTCVLVALVRELHAGAGTKPPAWLVDPPA
jgi:hypothetical protein